MGFWIFADLYFDFYYVDHILQIRGLFIIGVAYRFG